MKKLLSVLDRLVDAGNTVAIIEHNLDVIKTADWIIDLGPEGGDAGGEVIAEGTPEDVAAMPHSYTGQFLDRILNGSPDGRKRRKGKRSSARRAKAQAAGRRRSRGGPARD